MARPPPRAGASLVALIVGGLLAGCAGLGTVATPTGGDRISGRLAVRVAAHDGQPARSETAAFELRGDPDRGQLDLATPLGSVLARARWAPGEVVLATPKGESRHADLDALTREVLGESVPVVALFDWLRARPWPGAPSLPTTSPTGFEQLGWTVDTARIDTGAIVATRPGPPAISVRAVVDAP